ncbi:MAG: cobalamin biosynthesis protein CbiM [Candidatus Latescibacteria bacterium 4484_7]|nr:MAG: cobalamin biosynthesis protein CbiM [Candidatus Latescibacteria bacterium 4484_7]
MHIPDGYLSPQVSAGLYVVSAPFWLAAVRKVRKSLPQNHVPLLAMLSAFSFLIMMFNMPLPGGTTGHAIGGVLIAILVGPWAAVIALTLTLAVQAFFFGDGGILALGANSFNLAIVMPLMGYFLFRLIAGNAAPSSRRFSIAAAVGAYIGINIAAAAVAFELGIQPILHHLPDGTPLYCPFHLSVTIPAMMIPHLTIVGAAEAIITGAVIKFLGTNHPELFPSEIAAETTVKPAEEKKGGER